MTANTQGPIGYCALCDEPLDADNFYGEDDFPLCRKHHELFWLAINAMVEMTGDKHTAPVQLELEGVNA